MVMFLADEAVAVVAALSPLAPLPVTLRRLRGGAVVGK